MFNFEAWATEFLNSPIDRMPRDISSLFLNMIMYEKTETEIPAEVKEEFLYKVIEARAKYINLNITDPCKVFLMFLTKSPGSAVMYLYALRHKSDNMSMSEIANVFPRGFLTSFALEENWDKQKGFKNEEKVDNCLDHYSFITKRVEVENVLDHEEY